VYPWGDRPLETLAPAQARGQRAARRGRALGVLLVTAALAVLLAVLSHLAWPPVVVTILGAMPGRGSPTAARSVVYLLGTHARPEHVTQIDELG